MCPVVMCNDEDSRILCPNVGMLFQWKGEIKKFAPHLKVMVYHADEPGFKKLGTLSLLS